MGCKTPLPLLLLLVIAAIISTSSAANASCDCKVAGYSDRCYISNPPPKDYKCKCSTFTTSSMVWYTSACRGEAIMCHDGEYCPSNDASYCACLRGGGECSRRYGNSDSCSNIPCDCNKSHTWKPSQFVINKVKYHNKKKKVTRLSWVILAEKIIDNNSPETQKVSLRVNDKFTQTFSYSRTSGTEIQTGVSFEAKFPYVEGLSTSFTNSFTKSQSRTFGKSETHEISYMITYDCNRAKFARTLCKVKLLKGKAEVPFTMKISPKFNPKCVCRTRGIWRGLFTYKPKLIAKKVADYPHKK